MQSARLRKSRSIEPEPTQPQASRRRGHMLAIFWVFIPLADLVCFEPLSLRVNPDRSQTDRLAFLHWLFLPCSWTTVAVFHLFSSSSDCNACFSAQPRALLFPSAAGGSLPLPKSTTTMTPGATARTNSCSRWAAFPPLPDQLHHRSNSNSSSQRLPQHQLQWLLRGPARRSRRQRLFRRPSRRRRLSRPLPPRRWDTSPARRRARPWMRMRRRAGACHASGRRQRLCRCRAAS